MKESLIGTLAIDLGNTNTVIAFQDQTRSFEMYWPIPIAQNLFYEIKNMWESMD